MGVDRPIVTVDGPSGSGKSTVARRLAERLGFRYVDTGALYRALAWWVMRRKADAGSDAALATLCGEFPLEVGWDARGSMEIRCDGEEISRAIRSEEIGMLASRISARRVVREFLWEIQRRLGARGGLVFEGRDMGSWVFPDAEHRFFVTASLEERARRRHAELLQRGEDVSLDAVMDRMAKRDEQDSARALAPLTVPDGATVIDTTHLAPDAVMERMMDVIQRTSSDGEMKRRRGPRVHGRNRGMGE